jgi:hypothetical protein
MSQCQLFSGQTHPHNCMGCFNLELAAGDNTHFSTAMSFYISNCDLDLSSKLNNFLLSLLYIKSIWGMSIWMVICYMSKTHKQRKYIFLHDIAKQNVFLQHGSAYMKQNFENCN